ncbi:MULTISPECIES: hypothetical protein [Klebsiella]|uniref:Uncharacterized protein n=1 Tax=Klebsiella electrica TaxID=1259973 RepID=A0AAJ5UGW0_9ENTR|nr:MULTISPECIES: hypothetical protein [Klebsiella]MBD0985340.1 hypothetical protein [Klebsiella michiganensis]MBL0793413.1 hypothetical protein [Klebsiella michiganensis]NHE82310.1 hypothetical protein [Klebsiella michiganensis]UHC85240.1 hypothetical protein LUW95_14935 [Klebsiella michiganensis]WBW63290.1 hypothetical protein OR613_10510 [Klebsiella electrica]
MEKISFLYVSEITQGKIASGVHRPSPWVTKTELPASTPFDVTFGLILKIGKPYKVEIDISFEGKSLLNKEKGTINSDPVISFANSNDDYVSIENTVLRGVNITGYGTHKVVVTLHSTSDEISDKNLIHTAESYFFVSKDWLR